MQSLLTKKRGNITSNIALGFSILIIYILVYILKLNSSIKGIMAIIMFYIIITVGYKLCQNKPDSETLIKYILMAGFVMRIGYMLYTPCTVRAHDLGELSLDSDGHAAYILNIINGHLPLTNSGQFYHPPLYYILSALLIKIIQPLLRLNNTLDIINCARIVSCFFGCLTLYYVKLICTQLKIKEVIPISLIAFLPNFYLMGGRVNNDSISVFFIVMIMLYSIRWYKNQSIKNSMILALAFGFGIMSKISVGVMAIPTGLLMLYVLIKSIKSGTAKKTIISLCIFGAISIPIGMLYPIRNLLLFNQPFGYVLDLEGIGFSSQNYSFVQRFLIFPIWKLFSPVYNNAYADYNVWMYLLKGALFGEFSFKISEVIPALMILLYGILSLLMLIAAVYSIKEKNIEIKYLVLTAFVYVISYIIFNIRYPYGCTMDFRYIVPVYIVNAIMLQVFTNKQKHCKGLKTISNTLNVLVAVFSLLSILMFLII